MIDHAFQKSAILKLPKLVTCPSTAITTQSQRGEGEGEVDRGFAPRHFLWDEVEILRVSILQFPQWENLTLFFSMSPS